MPGTRRAGAVDAGSSLLGAGAAVEAAVAGRRQRALEDVEAAAGAAPLSSSRPRMLSRLARPSVSLALVSSSRLTGWRWPSTASCRRCQSASARSAVALAASSHLWSVGSQQLRRKSCQPRPLPWTTSATRFARGVGRRAGRRSSRAVDVLLQVGDLRLGFAGDGRRRDAVHAAQPLQVSWECPVRTCPARSRKSPALPESAPGRCRYREEPDNQHRGPC